MVSNITFGDCKNNLATTCCYAGSILYKNLQLVLLLFQLSLKEYLHQQISPPPFELRSNLFGVLNPSIKKFPMGKLSSIFVSETSNVSILPLIWSDSISNLFLMEFIVKCGNTSLSGLLLRNDILQSVSLSASRESSEPYTSNCLLKLSKLCQLKLEIILSQKHHSTTLCLFYLNLTFLSLNAFFWFSWNGQ